MKAKAFILALIYLLLLGPIFAAKEKKSTNPWQELFTEPFEKAYIIMEDWTTFPYSNQDETEVRMTLGTLEKQLRTPEGDYKIKDIAVIIHNHLKGCTFSPTDRKLHWRLKKYGFRGRFLLYSNTTNKVYDIEDKKKDLT